MKLDEISSCHSNSGIHNLFIWVTTHAINIYKVYNVWALWIICKYATFLSPIHPNQAPNLQANDIIIHRQNRTIMWQHMAINHTNWQNNTVNQQRWMAWSWSLCFWQWNNSSTVGCSRIQQRPQTGMNVFLLYFFAVPSKELSWVIVMCLSRWYMLTWNLEEEKSFTVTATIS